MNFRRTLAKIGLLALMLLAPPAMAAGTAPITVPFDHLPTGFELDGVHRDLPCEACHLNAVFKGTPRDCATCHISGSQFNATPKNPSHIPATNNCTACHDTNTFRPQVHFDHKEVLGSCVSCHNGTLAQGEGPTHPSTSQDCAACHTVLSWNPPKFVDHAQIPLAMAGFCIICHNGSQASGKPANHLVTNLECGDCHLTTTWASATFDHSGIRAGCFSCHDGTKAVGKQGNHMPTSTLCENCHTTGLGTATPSWVPSGFEHTQMSVQTCQSCHSGNVKISTGAVPGQPANHVPPIPSLVDCAVCHGNVPAAETWDVLVATIPALHAGLSVSNCLMCHAGQTFAGMPAPYIPMSMAGVSPTHAAPLAPPHIPVLAGTDCSACHGAAYQAGGFGPATAMNPARHAFVSNTCDTCHDTGKSVYVGGGTPLQLRPTDHLTSADTRMASSDCSVCHETTDWASNMLPVGHIPNPGNLSCGQCHTTAPADYSPATLAPLPTLHTGVSSNCGMCHGAMTALTWFNSYTPKDAILTPSHIPFVSGTDCAACHAANYVAGGFGPTAMSAGKHAFVPGTCDTCHEAGLTFYMGASSPALQGRPADHLSGGTPQQATGDCSGCHETTDWNTNIMPVGHMPNPANQACAVCHIAIGASAASYAALASVTVLHTGISSGCAQCHGAVPLTFYNNNANPLSGTLTPAHIPYLNGTDCGACHAANYVVGGFGPTNMSAAKHAFVPTTCDTCHEAGLSFYLGASSPPLQGRPADHLSGGTPQQATGDCSACHETTDWNTSALPAGHMPNPGNQACAVCHIAINGTTQSYATLASNSILHTGITTGCAQCHGGTSALTFYNNNDNPKSAALSPPHIPSFTGTDCSSCHVTSSYAVGTFGPMNMTQATHGGVGSTCNGCHEAGLNFFMGAANPGLQGRPADHTTGQMVAPNDCNQCHTTANWNSSALPAGHMPNPANQACTLCHTSSPNDYTTATLATNTVLHTGVTTGQCAQCHGGTTALTWYNNYTPKDAALTPAHIPYAAGTSCGICHSSTTYAVGTFGPMNMTQATHTVVTTACVTCHEAGKAFYMGAASPALQGRPADHNAGQMVAPNDCSICHTTANWNSTALPAGHMPNPGNQACAVCHTSAPADYSVTTLASHAGLHTGISSGCIACHGAPNATPPVFYNGYTPKDAALTPVHIPTSSAACESCHIATVFTAFSGTTMTSAKHTAMFAVIGKTCDACHDAVTPALLFYGVSNLTTRPKDHSSGNKKTQDCSACHNTNNWGGGAATRVPVRKPTSSTVTTVVRAPTVLGQPRFGSPIGLLARSQAATVSHEGVTSNCASCHNGRLADGIGPRHLRGAMQCQDCHTTLAWVPARTDHRALVGPCVSCHNGAVAPGMTPQHLRTTEDCSSCHNTLAWQPATYKHVDIVAPCLSCHNGLQAESKPMRHPLTAVDCGRCHTTSTWTIATAPVHLRPLLQPRVPKRSAQP